MTIRQAKRHTGVHQRPAFFEGTNTPRPHRIENIPMRALPVEVPTGGRPRKTLDQLRAALANPKLGYIDKIEIQGEIAMWAYIDACKADTCRRSALSCALELLSGICSSVSELAYMLVGRFRKLADAWVDSGLRGTAPSVDDLQAWGRGSAAVRV